MSSMRSGMMAVGGHVRMARRCVLADGDDENSRSSSVYPLRGGPLEP